MTYGIATNNWERQDRPRSGRPWVTTANLDRYIRITHARNHLQTSTGTARETIGTHGRLINEHTVRRRLRDDGMIPRRPYVGQILTQRHRRDRLAWARAHSGWARQRWATVLFSDESNSTSVTPMDDVAYIDDVEKDLPVLCRRGKPIRRWQRDGVAWYQSWVQR